MKIGVIGLGSIGERHVRNIQKIYPRASITILTKRTQWQDAGTQTRLINSSKEFYTLSHDVFFITNETAEHAETLLQCLTQKPRGIFLEKPLSHKVRDIPHIRKALQKSPTVFFVAYSLQFYKPLVMLKRMIQSGKIGTILSMRASAGQDLRTWRKRDYTKGYSADTKRGGGVVLDLIHELNYPAWLLEEPLQYIAGYSGRISLPIKAEDISEGIFRTPKGVVISIHQDYLQTPGRRYCEVVGTKGTIVWEGDTNVISVRTSSKRDHNADEDRNIMYEKELKYFMRLVQNGEKFSNFEEAARDLTNAEKLKRHAII